MFGKTNKKATKVLAYLLALMVLVSYYPSEFIMTALAETQVAYTITVTDEGSNPIEGANVVITKDDAQVGETLTTNADGEATAEGLADATEYSYTVTLLGYEDATGSFTTDSATDPKEVNVTMTALEVATITGTVTDGTDAYEGATVTLSGYGDDVTATTNADGEYTLSGYVGKAYTVKVTPKAEDKKKYSEKTSEIASATANETVDFVLVKNVYEISVSTNNTNNLTMGSVVIKNKADGSEIANLLNVVYGTEVIVEVTTEDGYGIVADSFKVGEEKPTLTEGKYTFTVTDATTVSVEFEKTVFDLKIDANFEDEKGSIKFYNGNDEITSGKANKGDVITVKVEPDDAYLVKSMTINSDAYNNTSEKVVTVNEDLMVNADFEAKVFEVEFFVTGKGTIEFTDDNDTIAGVVDVVETPQGKVDEIGYNGELVFNVIANSGEGYHIESIVSSSDKMVIDNTNDTTIIGENECVEKNVTISEIKGNQTVTVKFAINTYTITLNNYVTNDGKVKVLVNNNEVDLGNSNSTTVNHGDSIKLNLDPSRKNNKTVSIAKIGTYDCMAEDVFDLNWDWLEDKDGVTCTSDVEINFTFTNIDQCTGSWSDYIEIVRTSKDQTIVTQTDADGNYVYKSNAKLLVKLKENLTYEGEAVEGIDFLYEDHENFVGYNTSKEITTSNKIVELQINNGTEYSVNLDGKSIIFIIDKVDPVIELDSSIKDNKIVTNSDTVKISGIVTDENTTTNPSSGLDRVVYATGTEPADEAAVKALTTEDTLTDGKFEINVDGTAELNTTYYIYAIDTAGNVSDATEVKVVIDKTQPKITDIKYVKSNNGADITYKNDGIYCVDTIKLNVSVNDDNAVNSTVVSGVNQVVLCLDDGTQKTGKLENGTATFELTETDFKDGANVVLKVSDMAGNEITQSPSAFINNDEIESDYIVVNSAVSIDIGIKSSLTKTNTTNQNYSDGSNAWYKNNENIEIEITAKDELVGLKNIRVLVNGTDITDVKSDYKDETLCNLNDDLSTNGAKITEINPKFVLSSALLKENEENIISVVVTNNANGVTGENNYKFFIDKTPPKTDKDSFKFSINDKENTPFEDALNILSFGAFFNEEIIITVEATDDTNDSASGLKLITLYKTEEKDGELKTSKIGTVNSENFVNGKAEFKIQLNNDEKFEAILSAEAEDNVGNITGKVIPTTENSNIESSNIMIEKTKPTIEKLNITGEDGLIEYEIKTKDNGITWWYNKDVDFTFNIKDVDSGIGSVEISINDKVLVDESYNGNTDEKTTNLDFKVSTAGLKTDADGSYTLNVEVTDNAGNKSIMQPLTIYKDTSAPKINGFKFVGYDETEPCAEVTDYGFFFKQETTVIISAIDEVPTSGIKEITYYTVDIDNGKTAETVKTVNENGEIEVTIPANFKGQIYAKVNDNVLNTSEFVSPDKAVVESEEKHRQEKHIEIIPAETTLKTTDNSPLYKDNVEVKVIVTDTYSGIDSIEWSIDDPLTDAVNGKIQVGNADGKNVGDEIDGWKIESKDANLVTKMSKTITVSNNSNDIDVVVKMTDRAGNTSTDEISFNIDKTVPVIEVTYDNNTPDATYKDFYKENRTATITVTERNFNADDVKIDITNTDNVIPKLSEWKTVVNEENPDLTTHTATIVYEADGDYKFDIAYSDLATNPAADFEEQSFTIDKTKPVVKVTYDNNKALNQKYYAAERTATITVTEHNFDEKRIVVSGKATDNGKKVTFPAVSEWTKNGDIYTATISYKADAKYTFDIKATDKAGNVYDSYKAEEFYIDKTAPEVEITGVANNSANNGKVAPVVKYTDTNFTENGVTVTLSGVNRGKVDYSRGVAGIANGQTMSYENFRTVKEVDDIYTLTAKVVDMAGNETTKSITFSVNRFGSTYNLESIKSYNNKYLQTMGDLVFTELNVNSLDLGNIKVKLTKNGTPSDLVLNKDFTVDVSGGNGRWYTYTYTIKSALFEDDARYALSFYSVDASGNINENIDETKEAVVSFGVDKTKPAVVPIDLKDSERYKESVKQVTIDVKDNLSLEGVKIYLNDVEVKYEVNGESYTFSVPESRERQTIKVVAIDAAGNEQVTIIKDILVSTNAFVQWVNNTEAFVGTIAAVVLVVGGIVAFAVLRKKKRRK